MTHNDGEHRPSRFGARGLIGFVAALAFVVSQGVLTFMRYRDGGDGAWAQVLTIAGWIVAGVAITAMLISGRLEIRRRRLERRFPEAVVLDGYTAPQLKAAIIAIDKVNPELVTKYPSITYAVLFDAEGFALWEYSDDERPFYSEKWGRISAVDVRLIQRERSSSFGLVLTVPCGDSTAELPLVFPGRGIFALWAVGSNRVQKIAEMVDQFRARASRADSKT
jgi:hypothetical protein